MSLGVQTLTDVAGSEPSTGVRKKKSAGAPGLGYGEFTGKAQTGSDSTGCRQSHHWCRCLHDDTTEQQLGSKLSGVDGRPADRASVDFPLAHLEVIRLKLSIVSNSVIHGSPELPDRITVTDHE